MWAHGALRCCTAIAVWPASTPPCPCSAAAAAQVAAAADAAVSLPPTLPAAGPALWRLTALPTRLTRSSGEWSSSATPTCKCRVAVPPRCWLSSCEWAWCACCRCPAQCVHPSAALPLCMPFSQERIPPAGGVPVSRIRCLVRKPGWFGCTTATAAGTAHHLSSYLSVPLCMCRQHQLLSRESWMF